MATEDDTSSEMALATQKLARFPKHGWTVGQQCFLHPGLRFFCEMALATQKLARFPKHGWTVGQQWFFAPCLFCLSRANRIREENWTGHLCTPHLRGWLFYVDLLLVVYTEETSSTLTHAPLLLQSYFPSPRPFFKKSVIIWGFFSCD